MSGRRDEKEGEMWSVCEIKCVLDRGLYILLEKVFLFLSFEKE
jgi:hypothetical protein